MTASDVKAIRRALGLTQDQLAQRIRAAVPGLRTSLSQISHWETGARSVSGPALLALERMRGQADAPKPPA